MARELKYKNSEETQTLIEELKYNPAILELRFASIYDELFKFYGTDMTDKILSALCKTFDCDEAIIHALVNNKHKIQLNSVYNVLQYRRMMLVMGLSWGYDKTYIARHYFGDAQNAIYRGNYVSLRFLNRTWIDNLKYTVYVLNNEQTINQMKNLLLNLDIFVKLLSN